MKSVFSRFVSETRRKEIQEQSLSWPVMDLDADRVCQLELYLQGLTEAPLTVEVPVSRVGEFSAGGSVLLRNDEGVPLAALTSLRLILATEGIRLQGTLEGLQLPAREDFKALRGLPERPQNGLFCDGKVIAAYEQGSPSGFDPWISAIQHTCFASSTRENLLILASGTGVLDDPLHFRRVKALQSFAQYLNQTLHPLSFRCLLLPRWSGLETPSGRTEALKALKCPESLDLHEVPLSVDAEKAERGKGFVVFFTGLSGSGKSTVAHQLTVRLMEADERAVTLLDGDLVRKNLSSELGFSREHRNVNVRRIGFAAGLVAKSGGIAVCAPIAPYESIRREVRRSIEAHSRFILIHVATPLEVCEARDRKGLYAKARAGIVKEFTGISDPYETPSDADLTLDTTHLSVEDAVNRVLALCLS